MGGGGGEDKERDGEILVGVMGFKRQVGLGSEEKVGRAGRRGRGKTKAATRDWRE